MSDHACPPRRTRHKQRDCLHSLLALRRLVGLGWTDRRAARALSLLSPEAVRRLEEGGWTNDNLDLALDDGRLSAEPLPAWTRYQVRHYRRRKLNRRRPRPTGADLSAARRSLQLAYQSERGWGHLAPAYDEARRGWLPGVELTPLEVRLLCALRDRGPLTARELAQSVGHWRSPRPLVVRGYGLLPSLLRRRLVCRLGGRANPRYSLAGWTRPAGDPFGRPSDSPRVLRVAEVG